MTMLRRFFLSLLSIALLMAVAVPSAEGQAVSSLGQTPLEQTPLFMKMLHANAALHSYQSHVHVAIAMHSFPYLSPTLEGTAYYKAPDKNAIVFDTVPVFASLFKKVSPRLDSPARWLVVYKVSVLSSGGGHTIFRLEPKKYGTIAHLDVLVDEGSGIPLAYTYAYRNGGYVHFDQTVAHVDGVYVVTDLKGHVELPSMTADANSTFSQYHINIPVNDTVFTSQPS